MNSNVINSSVTHTGISKVSFSELTEKIITDIKKDLDSKESLHVPYDEAIKLLYELAEFELGRFLLHNKSLNGYWTAYIFRNNVESTTQHPLEKWLINESLLVLARERFDRFKSIIQKVLQSNMSIASIPCGLMDDLLELDFDNLEGIKITGIDLDKESLLFAKDNAQQKKVQYPVSFIQKNAWELELNNQYDLISSNGLNMYVADRKRLVDLYKQFYSALKLGGRLIISFLPPPPEGNHNENQWKEFGVSMDNLKKERAIFEDIIGVKFLNFCTEEQMRSQLEEANFKIESINYNSKGMLPIVVGLK